MTPGTLRAITTSDGAEAPPRRNGELVFEAPWESRAFGVAIALHDVGAIDYEVFRSRLIDEIGAHARGRGVGEDDGYYERWLDALEQVLLDQQIVSAAELDARATIIAHARDNDHDHHDHTH